MVLAITVVNRGIGEKITELYHNEGIGFNLICLGKGTANIEMLDILGIGEEEKDVVFSIVSKDKCLEVLRKVENNFKLNKIGNGIAFSIPLECVKDKVTEQLLLGL